jgi:hypothetical protein
MEYLESISEPGPADPATNAAPQLPAVREKEVVGEDEAVLTAA